MIEASTVTRNITQKQFYNLGKHFFTKNKRKSITDSAINTCVMKYTSLHFQAKFHKTGKSWRAKSFRFSGICQSWRKEKSLTSWYYWNIFKWIPIVNHILPFQRKYSIAKINWSCWLAFCLNLVTKIPKTFTKGSCPIISASH